MKDFITGFVCLCMVMMSPWAKAVNFKSSSVLSSGKWVKVRVEKTGIYELAYDKLKKFGFSNPSKVKVFGAGGNAASENYNYSYMDDLSQVPVMDSGDKIYFYGKGIVKDSLVVAGTTYSYKPFTNTYSKYGVYFLSDIDSENPLHVDDVDKTSALSTVDTYASSGAAVWFSERELYNPGNTGQMFLGDNILSKQGITYGVPVPEIANEGVLYVTSSTALVADSKMTLDLSVNGHALDFESGNSLSKNSAVDYLEYGTLAVKAKADVAELQVSDGQINLELAVNVDNGNLSKAWVDNVSVVYPAFNSLPADSSQTRRFIRLKKEEGIRIGKMSTSIRVWKVDEFKANTEKPYPVQNCIMRSNGDGTADFAEGKDLNWAEYVIFDMGKPQMQPEYLGEVENQNLHSMKSPDMLIITNSILKNQAERLAEYHRQADGMDVAVVEQDKIFNEFSSGIRDAMGYRRFCKMLYDRNPSKFQYLLLFGGGTYDNRMIFTNSDSEPLLTYQSNVSSSQNRSYSTDDFFGILDNSSSTTYTSRKLSIAVGRIPFVSEKDAEKYIDKLLTYNNEVMNASSCWKNNMLLVGENGDSNVHMTQCESFMQYFNATGNYNMNIDKLYLEAFSEDGNVRTKFVDKLNEGQNVVVFIGHGNPNSLTKTQLMMNLDKARETSYSHLPIMYFSTCDVGRFDNGTSNMVGELLACEKGGIITAVASTRVVYTNLNGLLSDSFAKSLAKSDDYYGGDKTIGKIMLDAKNNSGENSINKLKYHVLGDPAFRVSMPSNNLSVLSVNNSDVSGDELVKVPIGDWIKIEGEVLDSKGNTDSGFSGNLIAKLFDSEDNYVTITTTSGSTTKKTVLRKTGAELSSSEADIVSGRFSASLFIPSFTESKNDTVPIRLFAVDGNGVMLSGSCLNVVVDRSLTSEIGNDEEQPVIKAMYINDNESFKDGMVVGPDFVIRAEVSDNVGINASTETVTSKMIISFDGGKDTRLVDGFVPEGSGGGLVEVDVFGMQEGRHTAELQVADYSGNIARKTISFYVENRACDMTLDLDKKASDDYITVGLEGNADLSEFSTVELLVTDDFGNIYLRSKVNTIPFEWNLTGNNGGRLAEGDYNLSIVLDGCSTPVEKIVVLKQ